MSSAILCPGKELLIGPSLTSRGLQEFRASDLILAFQPVRVDYFNSLIMTVLIVSTKPKN